MRLPWRRRAAAPALAATANIDLQPLPQADRWLHQFHLDARRRLRSNAQGGHLTRRRGESLAFREFTPYQAGDDIRAVDWRVSARFGEDHEPLVRRFEAEQPLHLVVSVDMRSSMWYPHPLPKIQIALWLAEALARLTCRRRDQFVLHSLGTESRQVFSVRSRRAADTLVERFRAVNPNTHVIDQSLADLARQLPPTAVWLVIGDFYQEAGRLEQSLAELWRRGARKHLWRMLIDLNAWPMERAYVGHGARRLLGPGQNQTQPLFQVDATVLDAVEARIATHKQVLLKPFRLSPQDATTWFWPETAPEDGAFDWFRRQFRQDPLLKRLFMR